MSSEVLIDTDIYSEILRGRNPIIASHAIDYRRAHGRLTISNITIMEIIRGLQRAQAHARLPLFFANVTREKILIFDLNAAQLAGQIAGDLERLGQTIGVADPMIAAIALDQGLSLVTGNTLHFERVRDLGYPLMLQNWRQP